MGGDGARHTDQPWAPRGQRGRPRPPPGPTPHARPPPSQAALARGALTLGDVRAWLALASTPLLGAVARAVPGFRDRVLGNPRFLLVLAIEELIGCSARMAGEIQGRGDRFWQEINFVASDMSLESEQRRVYAEFGRPPATTSRPNHPNALLNPQMPFFFTVIGDFFIVWLLSPKASFAPRANTAFARAIAGLPAHALQVGSYSLAQRFGALAYRGTQFFGVGFGAAAIGHTLTMAMVSRQKAAAAARGEKPNAGEKELGPVLVRSGRVWGGKEGSKGPGMREGTGPGTCGGPRTLSSLFFALQIFRALNTTSP